MSTLVHMLSGSHVYGINTPTSDHDYKSVVLPSPRDIIMPPHNGITRTTTKQDMTVKSDQDTVETENMFLGRYLSLLCEGQSAALEMVFTPESFYSERCSPIWREVIHNRDLWISAKSAAFVGYCRNQANIYGIKGSRLNAAKKAAEFAQQMVIKHGNHAVLVDIWPEVEAFAAQKDDHIKLVEVVQAHRTEMMLEVCNRKVQSFSTVYVALNLFEKIVSEYGRRAQQAQTDQGADWKALAHAVRIADQAIELFETGTITLPRPNAMQLLGIRMGAKPYAEVATMIEQRLEQVEAAQLASSLQAAPSLAAKDEFVYQVYMHHIRNSKWTL